MPEHTKPNYERQLVWCKWAPLSGKDFVDKSFLIAKCGYSNDVELCVLKETLCFCEPVAEQQLVLFSLVAPLSLNAMCRGQLFCWCLSCIQHKLQVLLGQHVFCPLCRLKSTLYGSVVTDKKQTYEKLMSRIFLHSICQNDDQSLRCNKTPRE